MNLNEKLQKIASPGKSDWLEEAGKRIATRGARRNARKVALRVLDILHKQGISQTDLAKRMGVSRQQVTKIVKGKENFTFETIDKLEKALGIRLMTIDSPADVLSFDQSKLTGIVSIPIDIHSGWVSGPSHTHAIVRLSSPKPISIVPATVSDISALKTTYRMTSSGASDYSMS
ncbi:MAG TPA: helix-turn-helix domain-containing protein [Puia sp.]